tara:strand:+ start:304 stop:477 length:174 start_codon:yes stop_codon:yes gene_type:complete
MSYKITKDERTELVEARDAEESKLDAAQHKLADAECERDNASEELERLEQLLADLDD